MEINIIGLRLLVLFVALLAAIMYAKFVADENYDNLVERIEKLEQGMKFEKSWTGTDSQHKP